MVKEAKQKPGGPHYAAVLFGTRSEYSPPYDKGDSGYSSQVPEITYFAFLDKNDLTTWVGEASKANKEFFFFHVNKLGEMNIKVSVSTDL